jgi:hypothetical protein
MAMTNVQKNIASELQVMASQLISVQSRCTLLAAMYTNENMGALTDADFAEIAPFAHITAAEFAAAAVAIAAVNTALNSGTPPNWSKMLKIVEGMPK